MIFGGALLLDAGAGDTTCAGVLRCTAQAEKIFRTRPRLLFDAVACAVEKRLNFTRETEALLRACAPETLRLSGAECGDALTILLSSAEPERAVRLLEQSGLLASVLPEVAVLRTVAQPPEYHPEGDVLEHTCLLLRHMAIFDRRLAWSALLHDIGKAVTFSREKSGRIRFFGHEERGADMAETILPRFGFDEAEKAVCVHAIRNHMRFASVEKMRRGKLLRLLAEPDFALELELHRLDCAASHGLMNCFLYLLDALTSQPPESKRPRIAPWVSGNDLIASGLRPGPAFKPLLAAIYERQCRGEFATPQEALHAALIAAGLHR